MEKEYKIVNCTVEKVAGKPRTLRFKGSDDTLDRDREILTIDGWDLSNYKKNPVFLWSHNYSQPPIGKATKVFIRKGEGLMFDIEFAEKDVYEFADTIFKLYENGFMKAVSVGFSPDRKSREYDEDENVVTTPKKELWELSAVSVPANPNALIQASAKSALESNKIDQAGYDNFIKTVNKPIEKPKTKDIILFDESEEEEEKKPLKPIAKNNAIDHNIYKDFMSIEGIKASKSTGSIDSDSIAKFKNIFKGDK